LYRRLLPMVVTLAAVGLSGCDSSPKSPVAPSQGPQSAPQPTGIQVAGTVSDAAWRPLAGARVEVVDGSQAGLSTIVGANGEFRLTGAFDETSRFRATREGHVAATWPLPPRCANCNPNWWIHFSLESLAPHANIAGDYTLTFIADSACADLPNEARTRTYVATITPASSPDVPANSRFSVTVSGSPFLDDYNTFIIGVAGDYLAGYLGDLHGAPGLVEQVAKNTYITLGGSVETSVTDSTISAWFHGAVDRCELTTEWGSRRSCSPGPTVEHPQCVSRNHRLILTRR
jgi:hypothetical protein